MSKHQIIYTSCKRGIEGTAGGEQIYSHDAAFRDSSSDQIRRLFTYKAPTPPGGVMTDEIAETMPQAFVYQRLSDTRCALVLKTYLGRDYMEGGRFNNHMSHVVLCEPSDLTDYPVRYYGSAMLRSRMKPEEVRSSERPAFLETPDVMPGSAITPQRVMDFLCASDRLEVYKKMLAAMLAYGRERKRLVICDEPENSILWIAALQFSLPLEAALSVNFATYEYDPGLSAARICGVVPSGTSYQAEQAGKHFTFDLLHGIMPDIEADGEFFDLMDRGMFISFEQIQAFHAFIRDKLTYTNADEEYIRIYSLYWLFTDSLENIPIDAFKEAVQMANRYAGKQEQLELIDHLLREKGFPRSVPFPYAMEILGTMMAHIDDAAPAAQDAIRSRIAQLFIAILSQTDRDTFPKHYAQMDQLCKQKGISIPDELAKELNRQMLRVEDMQYAEQWRWKALTDVLLDHIADFIPAKQISENPPAVQLLGNIVGAQITKDQAHGFELVSQILARFTQDKDKLISLAKTLEQKLPNEQLQLAFWAVFYQVIYRNSMFSESVSVKKEVLAVLLARNLSCEFVKELIDLVLASIPIGELSREDGEIVFALLEYYKAQSKALSKQLLLLSSGMLFANAPNASLKEIVEEIKSVTGGGEIDLNAVQPAEVDKYIHWIVPSIFHSAESGKELLSSFDLFRHTESSRKTFWTICADKTLKEEEDSKKIKKSLLFLDALSAFDPLNTKWDLAGLLEYVVKKTAKALLR